ncbi:MAG: DUF3050 domain-containing protein [Myxococcales bacterium]|nr:DUF3050 domain-containing protein [Myxococcales bacterium]
MHITLEDTRHRLYTHPIYTAVADDTALRHFMRAHVFAVWDFQSLLTALRLRLTGATLPWLPTPDREARRLINEITLDEESAPHPHGGHASHFELYRDAMRAAGADTAPIDNLVEALRGGAPLATLLHRHPWPPGVARFVGTTFALIDTGDLPTLVAAFAHGREDIIPTMFSRLVARLADADPARWDLFRHYLDEHIHHDEERHGPMARALLARVCADDPARWQRARDAAQQSLDARLALWDAITNTLPGHEP